MNRSSVVLCTNVRHVLFSYSAIASWMVGLNESKVNIGNDKAFVTN